MNNSLKKYFIYALLLVVSLASRAADNSSKPFPEAPVGSPSLSVTKEADKHFKDLSERIEYEFKNPAYLKLALTRHNMDIGHTYSSEGYERLEFLGDGILEFVMKELLWSEFPDSGEALSAACGKLVDANSLSYLSKQLRLADISKNAGLAKFDPAKLGDHTHGDFIESLMGALYLDGGLGPCQKFVKKFWITQVLTHGTDIGSVRRRSQNPLYTIISSFSHSSSQQNGLGYTFQSVHPKTHFFAEFLGQGILKFTLAEMLYRRFPECNPEELTKKQGILSSASTLAKLVETHKLQKYVENSSIKCLIGFIFLDGGLGSAKDFVHWHWTGPIGYKGLGIPPELDIALKKAKSSPPSLSLIIHPPFAQDWPSHKNLLQQLLTVVNDTTAYVTEKQGEDHQPVFKTTLTSKWIGELTSTHTTKKGSEQLVAKMALDHLAIKGLTYTERSQRPASEYAYASLCSEELNTKAAFFSKLIEVKLMDFGISRIGYHQIAHKKYTDKTIFCLEIQGDALPPVIGEGKSFEFSKLFTAFGAVESLIESEFQKIEACIEGQVVDINESHLTFYKSLYEARFREHTSDFGDKVCNIQYEPVSKFKKDHGLVLTYRVSYEDTVKHNSQAEGTGMTALQAQTRALVSFVKDRLSRIMYD